MPNFFVATKDQSSFALWHSRFERLLAQDVAEEMIKIHLGIIRDKIPEFFPDYAIDVYSAEIQGPFELWIAEISNPKTHQVFTIWALVTEVP